MDPVELINKYGFPIVAAFGVGYMIYYVWTWVTTEIKPVIGQANGTLIALIDRIRLMDNDLIRLNQKVETVMELRGKTIEKERIAADAIINKESTSDPADDFKPSPHRKFTAQEINDAAGDD